MSTSFKNKLLTGLVILLLIANVTTIIFFWMGMKKMHPVADARQPAEYLIQKLGFNNTQQEQYKAMVKQHREKTKQLREQLRTARDNFFDQLAHENISDSIKNNYLEKISSINRELDQMTFDHFREVRKFCTPDQQQKFDKVIDDILRMMGGPAPHGDRPPPPGMRGAGQDGPPPGK